MDRDTGHASYLLLRMWPEYKARALYNLRVIVAVVVIYQLDIRTCTAQNCSQSFLA